MVELYNKSDFIDLESKLKKAIFIIWFSIISFALLFLLILVLSSYEHRAIFGVIESILSLAFSFFLIYLFDRKKHLKILRNEYYTILFSEPEEVIGKVINQCKSTLTLGDSTKVFEVTIKNQDGEKTYYLSSLFSISFPENKKILFLISFGYLKGFKYVS